VNCCKRPALITEDSVRRLGTLLRFEGLSVSHTRLTLSGCLKVLAIAPSARYIALVGSRAESLQLEQIWSAPPQTADIDSRLEDLSVGPLPDSCIAAIASLFNHLVGASEERRRHIEAQQ